ncbi:hypothetical protein LJK88_12610 [Paenibacillus sp. P26]|nr:hypothetical protein LJK88_12610 [Paenibacillus sp. P26]
MAHNSQLYNLVGSQVKVNRGGPDSIEGQLLGVHSDYMVLNTNNGVVYVTTYHVKSISQASGNQNSGSTMPQYIQSYSMSGVLNQLRHQHVQINRGGPEKIAGLVIDTSPNMIILVVNNEIIRIPLTHVKSITVVTSGKAIKTKAEAPAITTIQAAVTNPEAAIVRAAVTARAAATDRAAAIAREAPAGPAAEAEAEATAETAPEAARVAADPEAPNK